MDIDADKVDKMKVAELRAMLSSHDLDTKGTKPVLVARLKEFLSSEGGSAKADGDAPKADGDAPEVVEEVEEVEEGKEDAKEGNISKLTISNSSLPVALPIISKTFNSICISHD